MATPTDPNASTSSVVENFEEVANEIPFTLYDSFKIYYSWHNLEYYENQVLNNLPFFNNTYDNRSTQIITTLIDSSGNNIHEVLVKNNLLPVKIENDDGDDDDNNEINCINEPIHIVLIHGYGAALGFFYKNFYGLTSIPGTQLHAIDLLGFGLSSRPNFPDLNGNSINDVLQTENFFIDSFEKWRIKRNIKKFILIGHSLGGYLSCCYYLKYGRELVSKMILISPVGVEKSDLSLFNKFDPDYRNEEDIFFDDSVEEGDEEYEDDDYDYDYELADNETFFSTKSEFPKNDNEPQDYKPNVDRDYQIAKEQGVDLSRELTDHLQELTRRKSHIQSDNNNNETNNESDDGDLSDTLSIETNLYDQTKIEKLMNQIKKRIQPGKFLTRLWENHYTPFQIIRLFGPFAGKLIALWTFNRFSRIGGNDELIKVCNYTSKIFLSKGSGEFCLSRILAPGSLGKLPLLSRIPKQIKIKTLWLYGEVDWMSKDAGYQMCKEINKFNKEKCINGKSFAKFRIIKDAGHHLYVDNRVDFEYQVLNFIKNG